MIFNHLVYINSSVSFSLPWHPVLPLWGRSQDPGGILQQRSLLLQGPPGHAGLIRTALQARQPWALPPAHPTPELQIFEIGKDPWRLFTVFEKAKQKQNFEELKSTLIIKTALFCFKSISVDSEMKATDFLDQIRSSAGYVCLWIIKTDQLMRFAGLEEFFRIESRVRKWTLREFGELAGRDSGSGHIWAQLSGCASVVEGSPGGVPTVCPVSVLLGAVFLQLILLTCKHNSCYVLNLGGFHILRL